MQNRRRFLTGLVALTASSSIVQFHALNAAPTVWNDGEHDDTEGLNAFLSGRPAFVRKLNCYREGGRTFLVNGRHRLSRPITIDGLSFITIRDNHFICDSPTGLHMKGCSHIEVRSNQFQIMRSLDTGYVVVHQR